MYDSLHGLDGGLDELRGKILDAKPLPNVRDVSAKVRREEH